MTDIINLTPSHVAKDEPSSFDDGSFRLMKRRHLEWVLVTNGPLNVSLGIKKIGHDKFTGKVGLKLPNDVGLLQVNGWSSWGWIRAFI